jgi:two-component system response regulator GlrR
MKPPSPRPVSLGFGITPRKKETDPDRSGQPCVPKRRGKVLVVDQDASLRRILTAYLSAAGYAVSNADAGRAALDACVRSRPNLVISELHLSDVDGFGFLKELTARWPHIAVIILTGHATIREAVQATQAGAFSFLVKPVGKQELLGHVERATEAADVPPAATDWREQMGSRNRSMEDRLAAANRAAESAVPVLLTGPGGTGKELLARAIHAAGVRREGPFVSVNCKHAVVTSPNGELLGDDSDAEKSTAGSDTGAAGFATGAFRRAHRGTLLLNDVDELPASAQLALLRVLKKERNSTILRAVRDAVQPDVRLICTTSRALGGEVEAGRFLRGLFDCIGVLPIEMPPLGRRREDIPLLVSHFLEQAREPGAKRNIYTPEAIELLATTDWPENVRQLFDLVKQDVALSHGTTVTRELVQKSMPEDRRSIPTYDEAREAFARAYLAENLQRTEGNVAQAARISKRTRSDFYKLLARYRLQPDDFKAPTRGRRSRS